MLRIVLFLATNAAILIVISIIFTVFGLSSTLDAQGINFNQLLIMSAIIGMTGSVISLAMSKWSAKRALGVLIIDRPHNETEQWLVTTITQQAQQLGIKTPEIGIFDTPEANAFATGMDKNNALVAVSTGLLARMNSHEIEAVIGHEMTHISNGDMVTMALIQGVMNTFVYFFATLIGYIVDRAIFKTERGYGPAYYLVQFSAQLALGMLASIIVMWFSRYREFKADAGGAKLAGRQKMIAALQALQHAHEQPALPGQLAAFGIHGGGISKWFMSHPPLTERIAALQNTPSVN